MTETARKTTLIKVELTYSDGSKGELEGEAAQQWLELCNGAFVMAQIHGASYPTLPWKNTAAPEPK